MRIAITGASSFTGAWFAAMLASDGHAVTGTLQRRIDDYPELEAQRIAMLQAAGVRLVEGASYGNPVMADLMAEGFDRLCLHGADVRNYRSADFDLPRAVQSNLAGMREACLSARAAGTERLIWSGTVFEPGEGLGDAIDRAVSPYALSKWLSWQALQHYGADAGLALGKFVIPNPFGPLEQDRFCTYLVRCWSSGVTPEVRTPDYVRDNIPIEQLARAYADFVALPADAPDAGYCAPSGYVETQGEFTARFAREIGSRLGIPAPFSLARQERFDEPLKRVNRGGAAPAWDEAAFWDRLAADYARRILAGGAN